MPTSRAASVLNQRPPSSRLKIAREHDRCGIEVLANLTEHVAALGIERAHSKGVRIGLGVRACDSQFSSGPYAEELVEANRLLQVIGAVHSFFPIVGRWSTFLSTEKCGRLNACIRE